MAAVSCSSRSSPCVDGMITAQELKDQEQRLMAAMKALEPALSDDVHAKVTTVLVELTAYDVMRVLNGLQTERVKAFKG